MIQESITKRRAGISLLITLSVITAMLSLMGVMFGYISLAQKKAESKSALIEANILVEDLKEMLDKNLGKKPSKNKLQLLYSTPLFIKDKQNNFSIAVNCKPLLNRVPIVWLGLEDNSQYKKKYEFARKLFEQLSEQAEIKDPDALFEILKKYLKGYSGYFNTPRFIKRKEMTISKEDFFMILNRYRFEFDDKSVYKLNWDKYFSFLPLKKEFDGIDFDFLSSDLIPYLFDVDKEYVTENYTMGDIDKFLDSIGEDKISYKWLFLKTPPAVECQSSYNFKDRSYGFKFNYLNKRIFDFELQNI